MFVSSAPDSVKNPFNDSISSFEELETLNYKQNLSSVIRSSKVGLSAPGPIPQTV